MTETIEAITDRLDPRVRANEARERANEALGRGTDLARSTVEVARDFVRELTAQRRRSDGL